MRTSIIFLGILAAVLSSEAASKSSGKISISPRVKRPAPVETPVLLVPDSVLPPGSLAIKKETSDKFFFAQVRFENLQYFKEISEAPQLTSNNYLSSRLGFSGTSQDNEYLKYSTDFSASTTFLRGQTNFMVHEAFLQPDPLYSFGRKRLFWSELDSRYRMGLWEPMYALDLLRPEQMGLTGLFVNYSTSKIELVGMLSPVFIPSIGPDIREEGGALVTESRWYRKPSNQFQFSGNTNSITYNLDIPQISKLVVNPSAALLAKVGNRNQGWWAMSAAGYKPVNELALERQNFKNASSPTLDVRLSPMVAFHSIFSGDVGFAGPDWALSAGYIEDNPVLQATRRDWITQNMTGVRALSLNADFMLKNILRRTFNIQMGYLDLSRNTIEDKNSDGTPADFNLFSYRFRYGTSYRMSLDGELATLRGRALSTRFQYLYDLSQAGSIMSTEFIYSPATNWSVVAGADILGVDDEKRDPNGFINQFRANDRWFGGVSYVF